MSRLTVNVLTYFYITSKCKIKFPMRSAFFRLEFKIFSLYLLLNDTIPMLRNYQLFDICKAFQYNLKWLDMLYWKVPQN